MDHKSIRNSFFQFFEKRGHRVLPSASIVPAGDETLLFTNAGMNTFKNIFLGLAPARNKRVVDIQKCIRVSGKHNDLEQVGIDTYHHTFFEMLGNWSFGDYGKKEAIAWAWDLLTEEWKIPKDRLYATFYREDDEAEGVWKKYTDMAPERILPFDKEDNFWEMGESGPCGPCSEIHYDLGEGACRCAGTNGKCGVNRCSRYIEVWNLVFIQYNRTPDGDLHPLEVKHIDTGMGFERIACILQGKKSNYDTDSFTPLIEEIESLSGRSYSEEKNRVAMRVISDHLRAVAFGIADGVTPSNEGRGYVIRRILRRAYRYGQNIGFKGPFLHRLTDTLEREMGDFYPELVEQKKTIDKVILAEEEAFHKTLGSGLSHLSEFFKSVPPENEKIIPGEKVFLLYDTYGFPPDLTGLIAREKGFAVDWEEFNRAMDTQKDRSRISSETGDNYAFTEIARSLGKETAYRGESQSSCSAKLLAIFSEDKTVDEIEVGDAAVLIFDQTVFYPEGGGQVGDRGVIRGEGSRFLFQVENTERLETCILHQGRVVEGTAKKGDVFKLDHYHHRRLAIRKNHSATHLLQKALRDVLGDHIKQAGSLVDSDKLRFDFNHFHALTEEELGSVEESVNRAVMENYSVKSSEMSMEEAKSRGALAFFGEKYGEQVRVIDMGGYSIELCGGSHVESTGEIGSFRITVETSCSAGIRRIEAVTGMAAYLADRENTQILKKLERELQGGSGEELCFKVRSLIEENRELKKKMTSVHSRDLRRMTDDLEPEQVDGVAFYNQSFKDIEVSVLRQEIDRIRNRDDRAVVFFTSVHQDKVVFLCGLSSALKPRLHAGNIVREAAILCGGSGGGRADFAQAGGREIDRIPEAIEKVKEMMKSS